MTIEAALADAGSPSGARRADAARYLAAHGGVEESPVLLRLLLDDDTDVASAAAEFLLRRRDLHGARLVFKALASYDVEQLDHVHDIMPGLWKGDEIPIPQLAREVICSRESDEDEKRGAEELLAWLEAPPYDPEAP